MEYLFLEIPKRGDGGDDRGGASVENVTEKVPEVDYTTLQPDTPEAPRQTHKPIYLRTTTAPPPFATCALPLVPNKDYTAHIGSYQFGTTGHSRLEYLTARGKYRKRFDFSFEFKTNTEDGILFYSSDQSNIQFVSVFLKNAHVVFVFDAGHGLLNLRSDFMYNDNNWHSVEFSRDGSDGKLVIDNQLADGGKTQNNTTKLELHPPFYLGGINQEQKNAIQPKLVCCN